MNFISPVSPAILLCRLSFGSDKPAEQSTQLCKNQCQQNRGVVLGRPRNPEFRIYLNCNAWWIVFYSALCLPAPKRIWIHSAALTTRTDLLVTIKFGKICICDRCYVCAWHSVCSSLSRLEKITFFAHFYYMI